MQALRKPGPLFRKLGEGVIEEEYVRLGGRTKHSKLGLGNSEPGVSSPALLDRSDRSLYSQVERGRMSAGGQVLVEQGS